MNPSLVSVVVPAYNEASCIQPNLEKIVQYLRSRFSRFEVIVVDDGSTDDTQRKVAEAAYQHCQITPISFPKNHGKGFAVRQGILKAKGDVVLFTDADLSTPIEETDKALEEVSKGYPIVIASRQHPDSTILVHQSWVREEMGKIFNLLVRILLPLAFRDTQCGFKCFSQKAAREIFNGTRIDGFSFDVEVLLNAWRLGYPIKEIPISWTDSPASKVRLIQGSLSIIKELFVIYWNDRKGLYGRKSVRSQ